MTLSFPYVLYGYVYDSNGDIIEGATVNATGDTSTSDDTDSDGKYTMNLMDYASSGGTVTVTCDYEGESKSTSFTLVITDPGKSLNLTLEEGIEEGDIYLNTNKNYGNEVYLFNNWEEEGSLKTSDY